MIIQMVATIEIITKESRNQSDPAMVAMPLLKKAYLNQCHTYMSLNTVRGERPSSFCWCEGLDSENCVPKRKLLQRQFMVRPMANTGCMS